MHALLTIAFIFTLVYWFIQFARQEYIFEEYSDTVYDIEGRMEWANSRRVCPFGMKAQLEVSCELLGEAKNLWKRNRWQQAYSVALQSQEAMDRAQNIYRSAIRSRRR